MTADVLNTPSERAVSGAMALVMHAMFFALLVFGVAWQHKREPEAMVVDLWNNLPPVEVPKAEPEPPKPEPKVEPEPPKPAPKVEAKPVPKVEPKPTVKPDIALQDKKEKERKAREQELVEKKKREQEQARQTAAKQQQADAEAKQRQAREQEDALRKLAQQQATAQTKMIDEYIGKIRARILPRIIRTGCQSLGNPEIHLRVILLPDGNVLGDPEVRKSSGAAACDNAVARAVLSAQPLPVPADAALFQKVFRDLDLRLRPNE